MTADEDAASVHITAVLADGNCSEEVGDGSTKGI